MVEPNTTPGLSRRSFLTAAAAAATIPFQPLAAQESITKPNVLLILVDDLGYGDLSSHGANYMQTPNIDALMNAGMRFDHFYANCPVCSPTRAALLTGRYPDLVGVPGVIRTHRDNNWGNLAEDAVLLPQILQRAGYDTALIGKWHLGLAEPDTPTDRGFDHFHGFLGDMMDDYYTHRRHDFNYMRLNRAMIEPQGHATDLFSDWAVDYIKKQRDSENPFFLYLAYNAPHTPIQPPEEWAAKVRNREPNLSPERAKLVALIEHMDDGIGRVLDALRKTGADHNTLIVFTSDNGGLLRVGSSCGALRGGKQDLYEGGIRVPACAVWPGHIVAGSRTDRVAMTMDLYPTICEACGAESRGPIEGVSLLPTLFSADQGPDNRTLIWVRREGGAYGGQAYYAARHGQMKLLQNSPFEPFALYDLGVDPLETNPLATDHPAYDQLFNAIQNHINETGRVPWQRRS